MVLKPFALSALLCCAIAASAHAEDRVEYGLLQSEEMGVTITRGKAKRVGRPGIGKAPVRPATKMALAPTYRGALLGDHLVLRDGRYERRTTLEPIHQETYRRARLAAPGRQIKD